MSKHTITKTISNANQTKLARPSPEMKFKSAKQDVVQRIVKRQLKIAKIKIRLREQFYFSQEFQEILARRLIRTQVFT